MSLPGYAAYKESPSVQIGNMPSHWVATKVKHVCEFRTGWTPPTGDASAYEGENLWANISDLGERFVWDTAKRISDAAVAKAGVRISPAGSLLFSFKLSVGQVSLAGRDMYTNEAIATFEGSDQLSVMYAYYAFPFFLVANASENIYGAKLLNQELIRSAHLSIPPTCEQEAIASFLDSEVAKIDALIAEQQKLIALLAEKRQATITHAVTRGLNQTAELKKSGVEWLGDVPAHWRVGKVQVFARRESGHTPSRLRPEYWENCTIPWFTLADVWQIRDGDVTYVHETKELVSELGIANSSARLLPKGTVILSRTASVGYSAIMGRDMATTQDFVNWVCREDLQPEFLLYVLRGMRSEFDRLMMGSTHQTIYMPDIAKLAMALPPLQEQNAIVEWLDVETGRLSALTEDAERAVTLLKERRSALITAAVTGQIDVRNAIKEEETA